MATPSGLKSRSRIPHPQAKREKPPLPVAVAARNLEQAQLLLDGSAPSQWTVSKVMASGDTKVSPTAEKADADAAAAALAKSLGARQNATQLLELRNYAAPGWGTRPTHDAAGRYGYRGGFAGACDGFELQSLHHAARAGSVAQLLRLLSQPIALPPDSAAEADEFNTGSTALHIAAWNGHCEAIGVLLAAGADIDALTTKSKWTPLYHAARNGQAVAVERLLRAGADASIPSKKGLSCRQVASRAAKAAAGNKEPAAAAKPEEGRAFRSAAAAKAAKQAADDAKPPVVKVFDRFEIFR